RLSCRQYGPARAKVKIVSGQLAGIEWREVVHSHQRSGLQSQLQHAVACVRAAGVEIEWPVTGSEVDISCGISCGSVAALPYRARPFIGAGRENNHLMKHAGALRAIDKQPAVVRKSVSVRAVSDVNVSIEQQQSRALEMLFRHEGYTAILD